MESTQKNRWGTIAAIIVALLLIGSAVLEWMTYGRSSAQVGNGNALALTPQAGGLVMNQTPIPAANTMSETTISGAGVIVTTPAPAVTITSILVQAGDTVSSRSIVKLHASPNPDALVLNEYPAASIFTIAEPSGDYNQYPVVLDGKSWCRVRATDGLVGWLLLEELAL